MECLFAPYLPAVQTCLNLRKGVTRHPMKLTVKRVIPLVFFVVAILYLAFGFSLEQRRMIGDEKGWDPGSRAMPIGTGFLILGLSVYLVLKEATSDKAEEKPLDAGAVKLIGLTLTLSVLYICSFRYVGFVLSTNLLLFTLIYFNYQKDITWRMIPRFLTGAVASSGFLLLLYSLGRYITRSLLIMGKQSKIEMLTNRLAITGITFVVLAVIFLVILGVVTKRLKTEHDQSLIPAIFVAVGGTEFLYLVFKQIFWVSLAKGVVFW